MTVQTRPPITGCPGIKLVTRQCKGVLVLGARWVHNQMANFAHQITILSRYFAKIAELSRGDGERAQGGGEGRCLIFHPRP